MLIEFGEYLPDLPSLGNPGLVTAKNVLPRENSYDQFPGLSELYDALSVRCYGAFGTRDVDGNAFNFAGDDTNLYNLQAGVWTDVSGATYATPSDGFWRFTQYGRNVMATNYGNAIQNWLMGTSSAFANLGGSPPKARYITTVKDFVLLGNIDDAVDGAVPNRIHWSALGDPTDWTPDAATQSDFRNLDASKGWVTQVVGGEYFTVFQERAISRGSYVGSPIVFQVDEVESGRGTQAQGSVAKFGNLLPYLGLDGFYIHNGQSSEPIGAGKVDKTFYADLDQNYYYRITSIIDPINKLYMMAYPGAGNTAGRPNKIMIFNFSPNARKRWAYAEVDTDVIFPFVSPGYTLDELDAFGNMDTLAFSLDSRVWTGNSSILAAFNSNKKLATFTGDALSAILQTGEVNLLAGYRALVTLLKPLITGASAAVTMNTITRNTRQESQTVSSPISLNGTGNAPCRSNAFYHGFRANISGGFDEAQGIIIPDESISRQGM
jgi:hypothetical protein